MKSPELSYEKPTHCANCGTELNQSSQSKIIHNQQGVDEEVEVVTCPVCHYESIAGDKEVMPLITSREEFESKLRTIVQQASQGRVKLEEIIDTLREELEFTAQCSKPRSSFMVQIIDLGQENFGAMEAPNEVDYREKLIKHRFNVPYQKTDVEFLCN